MTRGRTLWTIAVSLGAFFLMAQQWAVKGTHQPNGNDGYLRTDSAGVEGAGVNTGVYGNGTGSDATGVYGDGLNGVIGSSNRASGTGVWGWTTTANSNGVHGSVNPLTGAFAIWGQAVSPAFAGYFNGNVTVVGTLSKSAGSFKIDHPLYPAERYLSHSFVESPEMKNIYDGIATLDGDGAAVVTLPEWFEALNKDFRYQLTCIGENAPVFIAEEISDNRFRIAGGYAGMKISWLVTGVRRDVYAEANRIPVEEDKQLHERGRYLHPELYGLTAAHSVTFERTAQLRAMRLRAGTPLPPRGTRR